MIDPQLPGGWKETNVSFSAANTTLAKILCDVTPPRVGAVITGELAIPGETGVRQRVFTGGQRIIDGSISSSDTVAKEIAIYTGSQTSLYADMGAVTTTTTNTLNRTIGSFITDGYKVGDKVMMFGTTSAANEGLALIVTTVTALTLVFNGTLVTNETMAAGFRVIRVSLRTRKTIAIGAGNSGAVQPVPLLGGNQDPAAFPPPDTGLSLSEKGVLIVAMSATVSALPVTVDVSAGSTLY